MGSHIQHLFLSCILIHLVGLTIAQPNFLAKYCYDTGNYTSNSTYQTNLNTLLSSLSSNTNITSGFYNISVGQNSNRVNAIGLCRGDVEPESCRTCLNDSGRMLRQLCPNQKEAIGWLDNCMLRYSDRSIFSVMETLPNAYVYNMDNASQVVQFNMVVRTLLDGLRVQAARGGSALKFATGNMSGPGNLTIYALVQCTPDLSGPQCNDCLNGAFGVLPQCCDGRIGGRVLRPSCHFRYEIGRFYNETLAGAPPQADSPAPLPEVAPPPPAVTPPPASAQPPPPQEGKGGMNTVALITLSTIMAVLMSILVL